MNGTATTWLVLTLVCIGVQGFFSMLEMACVSFNLVRLEYYVSKGSRRANWLHVLLSNPSRLFGTTLIGVNAALQLGSECSRQWYESMGLSPDWAPLSQVFLVLVFAELAPMFAARRCPEHTALLGIPVIYTVSRIVAPIIWMIGLLSKGLQRIIGSQEVETGTYLNREDLHSILADQEEAEFASGEHQDFDLVVSNIFSLRNKTAQGVMERLSNVHMLPSSCTVGHLRHILKSADYNYIPVYHRSRGSVVGVIHPRDLIRAPDHALLKDHARPPWFLTRNTNIMEILRQFRQNNQTVAVVLNDRGQAIGTLALNDLLAQIFGRTHYGAQMTLDEVSEAETQKVRPVVEKSFPGDTTLAEFNEQFGCNVSVPNCNTLAELLKDQLDHSPEPGDNVRIQNFEFTAKETSLMGVKTVGVRSVIQ